MRFREFLSISAIGAMLIAPMAQADDFDREGLKGLVSCFPAKYAVDINEKLSEKSADRRDVVDIIMAPKFKIYDGGQLPNRFFLKSEDSETEFTVKPNGDVPDFLSLVSAAKGEGDICIQDAARKDRPSDDEGLYFEMGLTPYYKSDGPRYSYQQLKEGTKDAKSLCKVMVPSVARMFMPDTDHLSVQYDSADAAPDITAFKDGNVIGKVTATAYGDGYVFAIDKLKDMGADSIEITGPHKLGVVPSLKAMKRFGIGKKKLYPELYGQTKEKL